MEKFKATHVTFRLNQFVFNKVYIQNGATQLHSDSIIDKHQHMHLTFTV